MPKELASVSTIFHNKSAVPYAIHFANLLVESNPYIHEPQAKGPWAARSQLQGIANALQQGNFNSMVGVTLNWPPSPTQRAIA